MESVEQASDRVVVLVVDDEEVVRRVASLLLEVSGYRVVTAANAAEAVAVLEAEQPDVVLLDVMLQGESGGEVAAELRARRPGLPIVLSSGYDERTVQGRIGEIERSLFIRKPYAADDLVAVMAAALGVEELSA